MAVDISVIIPVFNEESNLEPLYVRLARVLRDAAGTYEIIIIDDGSTDNSLQIIKRLCRNDSYIRVVRLTRNFGQVPEMIAGCDLTSGDAVVTMNADLQNPPEEIPKHIEKLNERYEVVFGVFLQRKYSAFRQDHGLQNVCFPGFFLLIRRVSVDSGL